MGGRIGGLSSGVIRFAGVLFCLFLFDKSWGMCSLSVSFDGLYSKMLYLLLVFISVWITPGLRMKFGINVPV